MTLTTGTLVQIIDDAIPPHQDNEMRRMVTNHGHLWIIDGPIYGMSSGRTLPHNWYWCKALSSGVLYDWNADEITPC